MKILNNQEIQFISGACLPVPPVAGTNPTVNALIVTVNVLLAIPHVRELTNYVGDLYVNGFNNIAEDDYFTQIISYPITYFSK